MARCARGGVPIKIRIVKGANLAMEQVEAALHGWPQAPYPTKLETDANFKRMVAYGSQPAQAQAVRLGVASHNLFDVAYGLLLRHQHGVEEAVEFEMLEGMANHQARAVQHEAGGLLLYAPVVKTEDFHSAIAYLVRRLDENTAPENFLHDLFSMEPDSDAWRRQRDRFLAACQIQNEVSDRPRRTQDRRTEQPVAHHRQSFDNEPDTETSGKNALIVTAMADRDQAIKDNVVDVPVLANGRLELRYYLREQALSQTIHRYGNILSTTPAGRSTRAAICSRCVVSR